MATQAPMVAAEDQFRSGFGWTSADGADVSLEDDGVADVVVSVLDGVLVVADGVLVELPVEGDVAEELIELPVDGVVVLVSAGRVVVSVVDDCA
jgi:hypothetical protein